MSGEERPRDARFRGSGRRPLITSDPSEFETHDHVAWVGEGPEALNRVAVATFATAVQRGQRLLFVADDPDPGRLAGLEGLRELLDSGTLQVASVGDTYHSPIDVESQLAEFERVLDDALADGYAGISVVADNSHLAAGCDEIFAGWLSWEATADRLQAARPINGVCFFDSTRVPEDRLADLAVLHPVLSADFATPTYRLFADEGVIRVIGELDCFCVEQLRRVLQSAPQLTEGVIDLACVDFIDHRALLTLNAIAAEQHTVHLQGVKPVVRRMWELLDVATPALEFSS